MILDQARTVQKGRQYTPLQRRRFSRGTLWPMIILTAVLAGHCDRASEKSCILSSIPDEVDSEARYLFYLHGRIIEDQGIRPTHPTFGVYEYEMILKAFADSGFCVISETRSRGTAIEPYAQRLVSQIRTLLERGVAGWHISVVGFSKGAVMALRANTLLGDEGVSFVILAGCNRQVVDKLHLTLTGRVLSVFDATDSFAGSCERLVERGGQHLAYSEIELNVESRPGYGHSVFYRPRDAWLSPVVRWIQGDQE